jgi:enoyl-CoA hydratase/carnithine racemase
MSEHIIVEQQGRTRVLRFARPEKKNALTVAMYEALDAALRDASADDAVRVVLITGTGDAFTSGNDLRDFVATPPTGPDSPVFRFLGTVAAFPKPVVAAVNGMAIGIGTTLLLHCDLVIAEPHAKFSLPFINLGLVPEAASSLLLPRMLGHVRAAELLLLGEAFDAPTAHAAGIINRIAAPGACLDEAMSLASMLANKPPHAMRATKALLKASDNGVAGRMQSEATAFLAQLRGPEFAEAVAAFSEKRPPNFD